MDVLKTQLPVHMRNEIRFTKLNLKKLDINYNEDSAVEHNGK